MSLFGFSACEDTLPVSIVNGGRVKAAAAADAATEILPDLIAHINNVYTTVYIYSTHIGANARAQSRNRGLPQFFIFQYVPIFSATIVQK